MSPRVNMPCLNSKHSSRPYGAHGAMPNFSKDPVIIAMTLGQALQTIVSRNVDPHEPAVLSITQFHAGSAYNVIPGEAKLCGTVRTFSDEVRLLIRERMRALCAGIASAFQVEITIDIRDGFSVLVNEEEQSAVVAAVARTVVEPDKVITRSKPKMGSEDFADMMQVVPGAYFLGLASHSLMLFQSQLPGTPLSAPE